MEGLGNQLIESAQYGEIEYIQEILNKDANIVNYANKVVFIFF